MKRAIDCKMRSTCDTFPTSLIRARPRPLCAPSSSLSERHSRSRASCKTGAGLDAPLSTVSIVPGFFAAEIAHRPGPVLRRKPLPRLRDKPLQTRLQPGLLRDAVKEREDGPKGADRAHAAVVQPAAVLAPDRRGHRLRGHWVACQRAELGDDRADSEEHEVRAGHPAQRLVLRQQLQLFRCPPQQIRDSTPAQGIKAGRANVALPTKLGPSSASRSWRSCLLVFFEADFVVARPSSGSPGITCHRHVQVKMICSAKGKRRLLRNETRGCCAGGWRCARLCG